MQTELKREWLLQLTDICCGLIEKEREILESFIDRMDDQHKVFIPMELYNKHKVKYVKSLLERGMLKWESEDIAIVLPKFQIIGNDLHGIAFKLSVMLNGEDVVVNKTYDKFKLRDDTVS